MKYSECKCLKCGQKMIYDSRVGMNGSYECLNTDCGHIEDVYVSNLISKFKYGEINLNNILDDIRDVTDSGKRDIILKEKNLIGMIRVIDVMLYSQYKDDLELYKEYCEDIINNVLFPKLPLKLRESWIMSDVVPSRDQLISRIRETRNEYGDSLEPKTVAGLMYSSGNDELYLRLREEINTHFSLNDDTRFTILFNEFIKNKYIECLLFSMKKQTTKEFLKGIIDYASLFSSTGNGPQGAFYQANVHKIADIIVAINRGEAEAVDIVRQFHGGSKTTKTSVVRAVNSFNKNTGYSFTEKSQEAEIIKFFCDDDNYIKAEFNLLIPVSLFLASNYPEICLLDITEVKKMDKNIYNSIYKENNLIKSGMPNKKINISNEKEKRRQLGDGFKLPINNVLKLILNKADNDITQYASKTNIVTDKINSFVKKKNKNDEEYIELFKSVFPDLLSDKTTKLKKTLFEEACIDEEDAKFANWYEDVSEVVNYFQTEATKTNTTKGESLKHKLKNGVYWESIDDSSVCMPDKLLEKAINIMGNFSILNHISKGGSALRSRLVAICFLGLNYDLSQVNYVLARFNLTPLNTNYVYDAIMEISCTFRNLVRSCSISNDFDCNFSSMFRLVYSNLERTRKKFEGCIGLYYNKNLFDYYLR